MRIAIAVFEGAEELDFAGPWEVLAAWRFLYPDDVELVLVGENSEPVTCAKGMRVLPEKCWDQLGDVDVLVYPGGRGTRGQLGDETIRTTAARTQGSWHADDQRLHRRACLR
jgi:putative intracellular protease/amidase